MSRYVLLGLSFIRNFFIARVLDPESYGTWVILMLVLTYGDQIHLGLRHAGDKEIPYFNGQGRPDEAQKVANTVFGGILALSVIGFVLLSLALLMMGESVAAVRGVLLIAGVIVIAEQVNRYYLMIMRVKKQFIVSSRIEIITETVRTGLVCALAFFFSLTGAISGFLGAAMFMVVVFLVRMRRESVPTIDPGRLKNLMTLGFSLIGVSFLFVLLINSDRLFAASVLSKAQLGMYGVAALAAQLPVNFTQGISSVVYPTFSERFGRVNATTDVFPIFSNVLRSLAFASPLVVVTTFFGATILIQWFLPAYQQSIGVLAMLLPGMFLLSFVPLFSGIFTAMNRARRFLLIEVFAGLCSIVLFLVLQHVLDGHKGVAVAMSSAMVIYGGTSLVGALHLFPMERHEVLKEIAVTCLPSLYCLLVVGIVTNIAGSEGTTTDVMIQFGLWLLSVPPLLYVAHHLLDLRKMWRLLRTPHE